jgi:hypothetical protein
MEKKKCVQCGKVFAIKDYERRFYKNRKLDNPKRCKECRDKNKLHKVITYDFRVSQKKQKTFAIKKTYIIIAVLLIAFSALFLNSKINIKENHISQVINTTDRYTFKSESLLQEHFNKHGSELGYTSTAKYESRANEVIHSPDALHKKELEDGDSIYYIKETNELVILSTDGYIRTYFKPEDGIAYYNRQ